MKTSVLKYLALTILCLAAVATNAQTNYAHQFKLIDSLTEFIRHDLKLDIHDDFYTNKTDIDTGAHFFLYASEKKRIESVIDSGKQFALYFRHEDSAILVNEKVKAKGYHTLIYKTAGTSQARLNTLLLSYPDEAIAFILFHEAVHQHVRGRPKRIKYNYEEALCDVLANEACVAFIEKTGMLNKADVAKQTTIFNKCYRELNNTSALLLEAQFADPELYKLCEVVIKDLVKKANQFQKDRMLYEVNNAYFLRNEAYGLHYFEVSRWLSQTGNVNKVIEKILNLPRK